MTTKPYAELLRQTGWFDDIWIDKRPKLLNLMAFSDLMKKIAAGNFSRVYDLQTSERTSWYYKFLRKPRPEWVGTAKGASHRHHTPERTQLHTVKRHKQQMAVAGISPLPKPDISWLKGDVTRFALPDKYAVIIPADRPTVPASAGRPSIMPISATGWSNARSRRLSSARMRKEPSFRRLKPSARTW